MSHGFDLQSIHSIQALNIDSGVQHGYPDLIVLTALVGFTITDIVRWRKLVEQIASVDGERRFFDGVRQSWLAAV